MKRKIIVKCLFVVGICILLYPIIAKVVSMKNQTVAISKYVETMDNMSDDKKESILEMADNYNKNLYNSDTFNSSLENNEAVDSDENQTSSLNFLKEVEVLAYIYIPKINVNLPIYEGTTDDILNTRNRAYGKHFSSNRRIKYSFCFSWTYWFIECSII